MAVLLTGGAGYIGSHTAKLLAGAGVDVVIYDNLSRGHLWAARDLPLVQGDLRDQARLAATMRDRKISAVVHFAALIAVGESTAQPLLYFQNNVGGTLSLLAAMEECEVRHLVFSSTAGTYGTPERSPIAEDAPQRPINPYGETKLVVEKALRWVGESGPLRWVALRYFNAAGADADGELGEDHTPETHLIPRVIGAALGRVPQVEVFGTDFPTPDGTCIRDYIHVADLAEAHRAAIEYLQQGGESAALNLGTGQGYSVLQVLEGVEKVSGRPVPRKIGPRRVGDPAELVADARRARQVLGWLPRHSDLAHILQTAWRWHGVMGRGLDGL